MNLSRKGMLRFSSLALLFVLLTVFLGSVLADDNATGSTDDMTRNETAIMGSTHGAEIRLLQLERRILIHNAVAQKVIDLIKAKGNDTTSLEALLQQSVALAVEVKNSPRAPSQDAVKSFIDYKQDANDIIKEFRNESKQFLTEQDKKTLKSEKETDEKELNKEIFDKIQTEKREHNAERLTKHFENMNATAIDVIAKVKGGSMTSSRAKEIAREHYQNQTREQRNQTIQKIKDVLEVRVTQRLERIKETETLMNERRKDRLDQREEKLKDTAPIKLVQRIREQTNQRKDIPVTKRNETTRGGKQ